MDKIFRSTRNYVSCFDCDLKYWKSEDFDVKFYCPYCGGQPINLAGGCILGRAKIPKSNVSISEEKHGG